MTYSYRYEGSLWWLIIPLFFSLMIALFFIFCYWKLFTKAGKPGWAALIPNHNIVVQLELIGRPGWWYFLFLVPILNIVVGIMMILELVQAFGKDTAFGCLTIFFPYIMIPILALGDAKYLGPIEHEVTTPPAPPAKVA